MPTVTGNGLSFDMTNLFNNSNFLQSTGVSGSSTAFVTSFLSERWEFTGAGFSDFFGTIPRAGTINTFKFFANGVLAFTATNLALPIPVLFGFMSQSDLVGLHNWIFAGNDTINGGSAGENLLGYAGDDVINGGDGDDAITPGPGVDQVDGGAGNDILYLDRSSSNLSFSINTGLMASNGGQTLADGTAVRNIERYAIVTGSGNDTFTITSIPVLIGYSAVSIDGGAGTDTLIADFSALNTSINNYVMWSNIETLQVIGGSSTDFLTGGAGNDQINGGGGDDTLNGGSGGVDILDGGDGVDTVAIGFAGISAGMTFTLNGFATAQGVTFANGAIVRNAEIVLITGGDGNDTLDLGTGFSGRDSRFVGGAGTDTVIGDFSTSDQPVRMDSSGFITWQTHSVQVQVERYFITGGSGDDTLALMGGADQLDGGVGNDTLQFVTNFTQAQILDVTAFNGMSTAGGATLASGAVVRNFENLQVYLSIRDDIIRFGAGTSGAVAMNITAGEGTDIVEANFAGDARSISLSLSQGGYGSLSTSGASAPILFNGVERLNVIGGDSGDFISGGDGDDTIDGGAGGDLLLGGRGADIISGGAGDDLLYGSYQGHSNDLPPANDGADTLNGGAGDDYLRGGAGGDVLNGGDGVDWASYWGGTTGVVASLLAPGSNTGDAAGDTYNSIENLSGSQYADTLIGDNGANMLQGQDGADVLNGAGGIDTAAYFGIASTAATWVRNPNGTWTVVAGGEGVDTLTSVEILDFSDRDVVLDNAFRTFTGDGTSDLLWRNANTGAVAVWQMSGATQTNAYIAGGAPADWTILGTGDFNGDGRDDIIWRNTNTTAVAVWADGSGTAASIITGVPNNWQFQGIGDFNFDGRDDFVWRNANDGAVAVWLMNGNTISSQSIVSAAPAAWTIAGIADFDGDGRDDFLLRNTDGTIARWTTDGVSQTGAAIVGSAPASWQIQGVGDFDGDGRADILFRNTADGGLAMWRMNGNTALGVQMVGGAPLSWSIANVGDYNGDGRDDILWHNNDGTVALWTMNGFTVQNQAVVATVPTEWGLI